jgi:hypothetical protein
MLNFKMKEYDDRWTCICVLPDDRSFDSGPVAEAKEAFTICAQRLRGAGVPNDEFEIDTGAKNRKGQFGHWGSSLDAFLRFQFQIGGFSLIRCLDIDSCDLWQGDPDRPLRPDAEIAALLDEWALGWSYQPHAIGDLVATADGPKRDLPNAIPTITFRREEDIALAYIALPSGTLV